MRLKQVLTSGRLRMCWEHERNTHMRAGHEVGDHGDETVGHVAEACLPRNDGDSATCRLRTLRERHGSDALRRFVCHELEIRELDVAEEQISVKSQDRSSVRFRFGGVRHHARHERSATENTRRRRAPRVPCERPAIGTRARREPVERGLRRRRRVPIAKRVRENVRHVDPHRATARRGALRDLSCRSSRRASKA